MHDTYSPAAQTAGTRMLKYIWTPWPCDPMRRCQGKPMARSFNALPQPFTPIPTRSLWSLVKSYPPSSCHPSAESPCATKDWACKNFNSPLQTTNARPTCLGTKSVKGNFKVSTSSLHRIRMCTPCWPCPWWRLYDLIPREHVLARSWTEESMPISRLCQCARPLTWDTCCLIHKCNWWCTPRKGSPELVELVLT